MKNSKIKMMACITLLTQSLAANPTQITNFFAPSTVGKITIFHDENGFKIMQDGTQHTVKKYWMDPLLRDITPCALQRFLQNGYIAVNKMSDNEFTLRAKWRLLGGGPVAGRIAYWMTKLFYYGGAAIMGGTIAKKVGTPGALLLTGTGLYAGTTNLTAGIKFAAHHLIEAANGVETSAQMAETLLTAIPYLP